MSEKFVHLAIQQTFLFEGELFTKITPLMARNNVTGKERLIPRSAVVCIEGNGAVAAPAKSERTINATDVQRAFEQLNSRATGALFSLRSSVETRQFEAALRELIEAQNECAAALGLGEMGVE